MREAAQVATPRERTYTMDTQVRRVWCSTETDSILRLKVARLSSHLTGDGINGLDYATYYLRERCLDARTVPCARRHRVRGKWRVVPVGQEQHGIVNDDVDEYRQFVGLELVGEERSATARHELRQDGAQPQR